MLLPLAFTGFSDLSVTAEPLLTICIEKPARHCENGCKMKISRIARTAMADCCSVVC